MDAYEGYGAEYEPYGSMTAAWKGLEGEYALDRGHMPYPWLETTINDAALHEAAHRVKDIISAIQRGMEPMILTVRP